MSSLNRGSRRGERRRSATRGSVPPESPGSADQAAPDRRHLPRRSAPPLPPTRCSMPCQPERTTTTTDQRSGRTMSLRDGIPIRSQKGWGLISVYWLCYAHDFSYRGPTTTSSHAQRFPHLMRASVSPVRTDTSDLTSNRAVKRRSRTPTRRRSRSSSRHRHSRHRSRSKGRSPRARSRSRSKKRSPSPRHRRRSPRDRRRSRSREPSSRHDTKSSSRHEERSRNDVDRERRDRRRDEKRSPSPTYKQFHAMPAGARAPSYSPTLPGSRSPDDEGQHLLNRLKNQQDDTASKIHINIPSGISQSPVQYR